MHTFEAGERFRYKDTGNEGTILSVQKLAGTVMVRYDTNTTRGPTHTLGQHMIEPVYAVKPEPEAAEVPDEMLKHDDIFTRAGALGVDCLESEQAAVRKLLNELYHDRARLEKVVSVAAALATEAATSISYLMEELHPGATADLTQAQVDVVMDAAKLRQFADTHG